MKKILPFIISVLLVLWSGPVFAENDRVPFDCVITVDGKEVQSEPGYDNWFYRYTSIADALGFTTSFNEEAGEVVSVNGDTSLSFPIGGYGASLTAGNKTTTIEYFPIQIINDKTYLPYYCIETLASFTDMEAYVDNAAGVVSIYTAAGKTALAEQADTRMTRFNEMLGLTKDKNYTSSGTGNITINLASELFGLSGTGDIQLETSSVKSGEKTYSKVSTTSSGLMNVIGLLNGQSQEMPSSETMEIFSDGQRVYLKGKSLAKTLLAGIDATFPYSYPSETETISDQWFYMEDLPSSYPLLLNNSTSIGRFIVDYCFAFRPHTDPIQMYNMMVDLLADDNVEITESNGMKTYTYKIDRNSFMDLLAPLTAEMSAEERANFDTVMNGFGFEISASENVSADGIASVSGGKISISNIPNPWNEDVFSGEILFTAEENALFAETADYTFPDISNAVNLEEYVKSVQGVIAG